VCVNLHDGWRAFVALPGHDKGDNAGDKDLKSAHLPWLFAPVLAAPPLRRTDAAPPPHHRRPPRPPTVAVGRARARGQRPWTGETRTKVCNRGGAPSAVEREMRERRRCSPPTYLTCVALHSWPNIYLFVRQYTFELIRESAISPRPTVPRPDNNRLLTRGGNGGDGD
jgi:hypothetical protein